MLFSTVVTQGFFSVLGIGPLGAKQVACSDVEVSGVAVGISWVPDFSPPEVPTKPWLSLGPLRKFSVNCLQHAAGHRIQPQHKFLRLFLFSVC